MKTNITMCCAFFVDNKKITLTIVIANFIKHQPLFLGALHMICFIPLNNFQLGAITISIFQMKHRGINVLKVTQLVSLDLNSCFSILAAMPRRKD